MDIFIIVAEGQEGEDSDHVVDMAVSLERAQELAEGDIKADCRIEPQIEWQLYDDPAWRVVAVAKWQHVSPSGRTYGYPHYHHVERREVKS